MFQCLLKKKSVSDTVMILCSVRGPQESANNENNGNAMWDKRGGNNDNQDHQHLTWYQAYYKTYMSRGRPARKALRSNRPSKKSSRAIIERISKPLETYSKE